MSELICYCFGYTAEDIEKDILTNKKSTIFMRIMNEKKDGNCQCAVKNPKGSLMPLRCSPVGGQSDA
ncbi:hypothetical protein MKHDV_01243 [Halodesulfovibrio sp. MK-HDV]|nr:hypothetical protein MKHDV_01243 [Halodesulfovibrio sp. MK-HDV]